MICNYNSLSEKTIVYMEAKFLEITIAKQVSTFFGLDFNYVV